MTSPILTASEARDAAFAARNYTAVLRGDLSDSRWFEADILARAVVRYAALADKLEAIAQEHGRE